MNVQNIITFILSMGFLIVTIFNFFRELEPLLLVLNIVGFFCFLLLVIAYIRKIALEK